MVSTHWAHNLCFDNVVNTLVDKLRFHDDAPSHAEEESTKPGASMIASIRVYEKRKPTNLG